MVNYLIVLFAVTNIFFASAERISIYIRLIAMQGLLLCGIALAGLSEVNLGNLIFIAAETIVFKTVIMPYLLFRLVKTSGVTKVHRLSMPAFYNLLFSIFALLISAMIAKSMLTGFVSSVFMTVALYTLFVGLLLIVTHRLIVSHIIGFMITENAVFLFSVAVGNEMPMLINIGILLDIFAGVLILGFFGLRIRSNTNEITKLKD